LNPTNHYGATAARRHGKPGREVRPQSITIDIHSHVAVPAAADFIKPHLDLSTIPLAHFATPETKALAQKQEADRRSRITKYDERLRDMDAMGVDMQLVMPPPPQCYFTVPAEFAVPAIRMINDGIAQYVAGKPDRFVALGTVPLQDGDEARRNSSARCARSVSRGHRSSPTLPARSCPTPPLRRSGPRRKRSAHWW
jgi:aminocarboxymuconate-semialdehyde decarboxylase